MLFQSQFTTSAIVKKKLLNILCALHGFPTKHYSWEIRKCDKYGVVLLQDIPKWWVWCYWISPTSWSLKGIITSQYWSIKQEILVFGEKKPLNSFLEDYFGYHFDNLGIVAVALAVYPLFFSSLFAFFINKLNFQRRWKKRKWRGREKRIGDTAINQGIEEVLILQIWECSVISPNYGVASLVSPKDGLSM